MLTCLKPNYAVKPTAEQALRSDRAILPARLIAALGVDGRLICTDDRDTGTVFVFNGARSSFPSGVFESREAAVLWIREKFLSGTLTEYPLGVGVCDWAVSTGNFKPKRPDQEAPGFIERFTSGAQWHEHYENGKTMAETPLE